MTWLIRVTPQAQADVTRAVDDYEALRPGWGDLFIDQYERAAAQIRRHPNACQRIARSCRRRVLHKFPFIVVYRTKTNVIEIIGVFPTRADPMLIAERIEDSPH